MDILISIFFALIFAETGRAKLLCSPEPFENCSIVASHVKVILVDNQAPKEKCSSVKIGSDIYLFDPVNITKVWITLINSDKECTNATMNGLIKDLKLIDEVVILIEVTEKFFRMIFARSTKDKYVATFPPKFDQKLSDANLVLFPYYNDPNSLGHICLNGGIINTEYKGAGYKCICPKNSISFGPRCEYVDRVLNSSVYYFNVFRNDSAINLTFSLFSNGVKKNQSLVTIKNSRFQKVVEFSVRESVIFLSTIDKDQNQRFPIDTQEWNDFYLDISKNAVSLKFSSVSLSVNFTSEITESFLSYYLVLKEDNFSEFSICIRNLKSNNQIIDLNNSDGYESCCLDRCLCSESEDCACLPFMSSGTSLCFCKIGYDTNLTSTPKCLPSSLTYSQITDSIDATYEQKEKLSRIDFKFRTLSTDGTLLTLIPIKLYTNISTRIVNTNLTLFVNNQVIRPINFNVSNGHFHSVTLYVRTYSLEMILDDNGNYSVTASNSAHNFNNSVIYNSFKLGPMLKPYNSTINNFTTCFSAIRINGASKTLYDIDLLSNKKVLPSCSSGPKCNTSNINCPPNQICYDKEWQFTKCICIANFTSVDFTCIYNKCINKPCLYNMECGYNATEQDYFCLCKNGYSGKNCEIVPIVTATLWWIAILVVLLLLLILLIILLIYCCCCRKQYKTDSPNIDKIQENIVVYNEQAGECDYNGPPINYDKMKAVMYNKGPLPQVPIYPNPDFITKKIDLENNNTDLILDHPLEYGYEGFNSDNESVCSLGSNSTNSQLNTLPLDNANSRFSHLNKLYK